ARRMGREVLSDHVFIASSGMAFLALFALLPTLTALISVYGLVTSPAQLSHQLQSLSSMAPPSVVHALHSDMNAIVRASGLKLGFSIVLSIIAAVWVAVRGVLGIISALNIVYEEEEKRSWTALFGTALALALGALVFWLLALAMIVGAPLVIHQMSSNSTMLYVFALVARWLVIAITALVSMTMLYRFGPSHSQPRWEWVSAGSVFSTALWLAASASMSLYISHVGQFGNVYGSLGMVMVVMTWFFLTALVFLLGAEFNIEMERQTNARIRD
uniref:YihY/virulence factor BrkB family protein n=1 Tax=Oleiagrimonas sp. TaxID=2010330 RepID=UPI00262963B6